MAFKRMTIDGYGQLEINNVAFRRAGKIEAQCGLDATDFASVPAENGMVLVVDKAKKVVRFMDDNETLPLALNYTTEHMYIEWKNALKDFKIEYNANGDYFYPRMGYLSVGDVFTTNCVGYDSTEFADDDALIDAIEACATTALYAVPTTVGAWKLTKTAPTSGLEAKVVMDSTMPDGQQAVKLQVISL